jgi:hypothetical protein
MVVIRGARFPYIWLRVTGQREELEKLLQMAAEKLSAIEQEMVGTQAASAGMHEQVWAMQKSFALFARDHVKYFLVNWLGIILTASHHRQLHRMVVRHQIRLLEEQRDTAVQEAASAKAENVALRHDCKASRVLLESELRQNMKKAEAIRKALQGTAAVGDADLSGEDRHARDVGTGLSVDMSCTSGHQKIDGCTPQ